MGTLEFKKVEDLTIETKIYQTDDGTIFYYRCDEIRHYASSWPWSRYTIERKPRLFVKWDGPIGEIFHAEATVPYVRDIMYACALGNALYFLEQQVRGEKLVGKTVYKAVFAPPSRIDFSLHRQCHENEYMAQGGLFYLGHPICIRDENGKKYVSGLCDVNSSRIRYDDYNASLWHKVVAVHRGRAVYAVRAFVDSPTVEKVDKHSIYIHSGKEIATADARDSSTLIYIASEELVHVLDTETMAFRAPLRIEWAYGAAELERIVGVRNRVITVEARMDGEAYLMSAKLPTSYETDDSESESGATTGLKQE